MLKHNKEMVSFVVKVRQPLLVLKDVDCTDNAQQIYGGKMLNNLQFTVDSVVSLLLFFFSS
jgi:hypothetical protein